MRFALVGVIGAVVDFGVFNLLSQILGLLAVPSSIISFLLAVVSNFLWNRYWTYPDSRSKAIHLQVGQFISVSLIGLLIRTPLFAVLEPILVRDASYLIQEFPRVSFFDPTFIGHNTALAIAVLVVMLWNFFANRFWTYSDVS
jgi:putative flippase GtrA